MANYADAKRAELLTDASIIRNRLKVNAFIENAKAYLRMQEADGDFSEFIWSFVDGTPQIGRFATRLLATRQVVAYLRIYTFV